MNPLKSLFDKLSSKEECSEIPEHTVEWIQKHIDATKEKYIEALNKTLMQKKKSFFEFLQDSEKMQIDMNDLFEDMFYEMNSSEVIERLKTSQKDMANEIHVFLRWLVVYIVHLQTKELMKIYDEDLHESQTFARQCIDNVLKNTKVGMIKESDCEDKS